VREAVQPPLPSSALRARVLLWRVLSAACVSALASGCGGLDDRCEGIACSATTPGGAGSSGAAGGDPAGASTFESLTVTTIGGNVPTPQAGSTCALRANEDTLTLDRALQRLSWDICSPIQAEGSRTGERQLSDAELAAAAGALGRVSPSSAATCGADDGVLLLDVTTAAGVELYADDFYSGCPWGPLEGRIFVTGARELANMLWAWSR
jgi:hypothetical protein